MRISVGSPGLLTTVQDLGRTGHQIDGVPVGGAMDVDALRIASLLAGNDETAAALEITIVGPSLTFDGGGLIALAGSDLGAALDGQPFPPWHAAAVRAGSTLTFRGSPTGCHACVAVAGGIDVPRVLGSRATYLRAAFGGVNGRALRSGDVLSCGVAPGPAAAAAARLLGTSESAAIARWTVPFSGRRPASNEATIRVVDGAHTSLLTDAARDALYSDAFRVSTQSDRMGYRLTGVPLELRTPVEILSEGVTFGTIQLPPGGNPIVLMADRQTTGGYPRIGEVASVDLGALAQLRPGDAVRFTPIGVEEAQRLLIDRETELATLARAIAMRLSV